MPSLLLSHNQKRILYDHLRSTLAFQRVQDDPDTQELQAILKKLSQGLDSVFCESCWKPEVHAKGKCRTCYMRDYRKSA